MSAVLVVNKESLYRSYHTLRLKLGSCPNDDKSVHLIFVLFCVVYIYIILFSESVAGELLLRIHIFSFCLYFLCVGILVLKNSFVTCL